MATPTASIAPQGGTREQIELFLLHEARLLDQCRFEEWMELFTEDGYYWAPARPDQENPDDEVSLIYDDREFMKNRILRLRHDAVHSQIPSSRTCHMVSNVIVDEEDGAAGEYLVSSCFMMLESRRNNQRVFGGHYQHRLIWDGDSFRIAWKKAILVNCDAVLGALSIPF